MEPIRRNSITRARKALGMALSSRHYFCYAMRLLLGCCTSSGRARFRRQLQGLNMPARRSVEYPQWLASNIAARGEKYRAGAAPGMFSFLTTVYETKGRYVLDLFESVKQQTVGEFEWILLDNGSTKSDTLAAIEQVRQDPRVVYVRVEENLGILGGISLCLQRATGRYVVPLDSDDLMTPDALAILRHHILAGGGSADGGEGGGVEDGGPALLFTDEDKCRETPAPFEAYHKPEWDPVLFWNSCYIAHLCAVRRDLAIQLGVYTDDNAHGCHDWDTFFRFYVAGHEPVHVPEVTYSWRQHPQSCAGNIFSKSYIHESHQHVLMRNLELTAGTRLFELTQSPLFVETPDWWVKRKHIEPQRLVALYVHRGDASVPAWLRDHELVGAVAVVHADQLSQAERALAELGDHQPGREDLVLVVGEGTEPAGDEWPWEVMAMFERFADTSVVGGRLLDEQGNLWSAGEVAGFGGIVGAPDRGRQPLDPGYFAWLRKQRTVTALHPAFCAVRAGFLTDGIALDPDMSFPMLGAWLGALARERKRRVVFSPVIEASIVVAMLPSEAVTGAEARRFFARFPTFVDRDDYYPMHFGLEPSSAFAAVAEEERRDALLRLRSAYMIDVPTKTSARGQQVVA